MTPQPHSLRGPVVLKSLLAAALLAALAGRPGPLRAETPGLVGMSDVASGTLLLETVEPGKYLEAPRLSTDVAISVTGTVERTRVTQRFANPSAEWVEAVYVFPLPQGSAVDTLRMQVGERLLEGQVQERQQARATYEAAAAAGLKATLVEQQRPNVFTNKVANIGPHESVIVQIEYQGLVRLEDDRISLRFPLVVAPRYAPGAREDADLVTAAVVPPDAGPVNPVTLSVEIASGAPFGAIESTSHEIDVARKDGTSATVTLSGDVPADRDFVLSWKLLPSKIERAALFRESRDDGSYFLAMIVPPVGPAAPQRLPRETVFVIDNSGSMAGESLRQAKAALLLALRDLRRDDVFNVIRFDSSYEMLFPSSVRADASHLRTAEQFVDKIEAGSGTEILPALQAALRDPTPGDTTHLRQVVFLTDGGVNNEDELLQEIERTLGRSRLFTIGIGSAPNSFLMEHMARLGRGTYTHIGSESEVDQRVAELLSKIESPVMTDLSVRTSDPNVEVWPNPIPDLYAGEPVLLSATGAGGTLEISGRAGGRPWSATLDLGSAGEGAGIEKLWARAKIAAVEEWRYRGASSDDVDAEVLKLGLAHHLVTRVTSLVAVDVTPSRPANEGLNAVSVPLNLPKGWDFDKVRGSEPATAIRFAAPASSLARLAQSHAPGAPGTPGVQLPQTDLGTDSELALGVMLLLLGGSLAVALVPRRPTPC
ncbi:MAG TPA: marine proteobacterial sortase target protein [Myxococcota bacterium]|nr:marine proteobacterial sortase target protein [Myxococcota bacterium]